MFAWIKNYITRIRNCENLMELHSLELNGLNIVDEGQFTKQSIASYAIL